MGRARGTSVALAICTLLVWLAAVAPAHAASFLAGAGVQITTPPAPGAVADPPEFAACAAFPDRGRFALQEPFVDTNGNGQWDPNASFDAPPSGPPELYCDANGNGRWDGIYADNNLGPATGVHDDIDVRAVAISSGSGRPVVYASVDQIGIFDFYTDDARARLKNDYGVDADLVVSANHNESSPDTIGLYGAATTPAGVSARSGIDEYFMSYLDDKIAHAAADAVHALKPAELYANQVQGDIPDGTKGSHYPLLTGMSERISDQFPTSVANPTNAPDDNRVAAVDPKLGVLQARTQGGTPIFTVMSLAAHNQEMGNATARFSADWPGAFERAFDAGHPGTAVFLVGDNGSEEDPQTEPPAVTGGSENHNEEGSTEASQFTQADATGRRFAAIVGQAARDATQLRDGAVKLNRRQVCVPLENNGFAALAAAGEFGRRQAWACDPSGNPVAPVPNGSVAPTGGSHFRTFVSFADIGPDLQLIGNPAESFPALMLGSPFGVEEESCDRPNPAVPTWHARAPYRFQVGLADDLIGYLIPAWGFVGAVADAGPFGGVPGLFNNDTCSTDRNGHRHKLESESVGPTGGNIVADTLATMLDTSPDGAAKVIHGGRFVLRSGALSRWPTDAAGVRLADGTLLGGPTTAGFGGRAVARNGLFMDYDGQPQAGPDITTRGLIVLDAAGCATARYYLDVFPAVTANPVGAATSQPALDLPACPRSAQSGLQPGAAAAAGLTGRCVDRTPPRSTIRTKRLRRGRLLLRGRAADSGCRSRIARVTVTVARHLKHNRCRFLGTNGRVGRTTSCRRGVQLLARGRTSWSLNRRARLPKGHYQVVVRAVDTAGNVERVHRRGRNVAALKR